MRTQTVVTLACIAAGLYFFNKMKNSAAQIAANASPRPVSGMTGTGSAFPLGCGSVSVNGSYLDGVYPDLGLGKFRIKSAWHAATAAVTAPIKVAAAPVIAAKVAVQGGNPRDVLRAFTSASMAPIVSAQKIAREVAPSLARKLEPMVARTVNVGGRRSAPSSGSGHGIGPGPDQSGGLDMNGNPAGQQYSDAAGNPITAQQYYDAMHPNNSGGSGSGTENSGGGGGADPYNSSDWTNADGSTVSQPSSDDSMYPSDTSAPGAQAPAGPGLWNPAATDPSTAPDVQQGGNYGTLIAGGAAIAAAYFLTK